MWAGAVIPLAVVTPPASAQANVMTPVPAPTAVIHVPADQPTVQAGIDAAPSGGQVLVSPGVYHERIDFHGKAVDVASAQGSQATVLDGDHGGTVVTFASGEGRGSVLRGFTVRNGTTSGIAVWHSSPTMTGNVVSGNVSSSGGGIDVENSAPRSSPPTGSQATAKTVRPAALAAPASSLAGQARLRLSATLSTTIPGRTSAAASG